MDFDVEMHRKKGLPRGHHCVIQKLCSCDGCIGQQYYNKEAVINFIFTLYG